jgi:response regulator of citrate/malate metabolism
LVERVEVNPFFLFKRFAAEELEKSLTEFLVNNRIFQMFAHRSQKTIDEAAKRVAAELAKANEKVDKLSKK